jgi:hypothetical protein
LAGDSLRGFKGAVIFQPLKKSGVDNDRDIS